MYYFAEKSIMYYYFIMRRDIAEHDTGIGDKIIDLYQRRPKTAILMSGGGSNAESLLSDSLLRDLYDIDAVFTDNERSRALEIADKHSVSYISKHAPVFVTPQERSNYFSALADEFDDRGIDAIFYAGFMRIVPQEFCERFPGVNIHPADLTLLGADGLPLFRGMRAMETMRKRLQIVRSTVHVVDVPLDSGLSISLTNIIHPPAEDPDVKVHENLKVEEHWTFKRTLQLLGLGVVTSEMLPMDSTSIENLLRNAGVSS